jgi:DNA-binding beta-propeller fold protein YncE
VDCASIRSDAMKARLLALVALLVALAVFVLVPLFARTRTGQGEPPDSRAGTAFTQDGFRVAMEVRSRRGGEHPPVAWDDLELAFSVAEDRPGGEPLAGLSPLAWLVRREAGEGLTDREQCRREIQALLAGRLAKASAVNLNEYYVVTLDDNNSLSIIDPQIESARTKTVGIVPLTGKGADFVLAGDRRTVLVTLPEVGRLAAADVDRRMARYLDLGGRPSALGLQPDGHYAWVGQESGTGVDVVRVGSFERAKRLELGAGPHLFAFTPDSRWAWVLARGSGTLQRVDVHALEPVASFDLGPGTLALAYSAAGNRVYAARADGTLFVLEVEGAGAPREDALGPGLSAFALDPAGRTGFALFADEDKAVLYDTATARTTHTIDTEDGPQRVEFTAGFAYLSHRGSERMVLVDLGVLRQEGRVLASSLAIGQRAPLDGLDPTRAPLLAPLPEGGGAMLLVPSDRSLYHFMEGMNAPMGSYRTYPWAARGVLLVDRTLRELEPGRYATTFQAPGPGRYTVPFVLPSPPQLYGCFELELGGLPRAEEPWKSLRFELVGANDFPSGATTHLELAVFEAESQVPLADLPDLALLVRRGPRWQWNGVARPLGAGRYRAELTFPEPGRYQLFLASASRGVELGELPTLQLEVRAPPGGLAGASERP